MTAPTTAPETTGTSNRQSAPSRWLWGEYAALGATIALITLLLDQANKLWMLLIYGIEGRGRVAVTPFLDFVYVLNTGVSYSMFDSSGECHNIGLYLNSSRLLPDVCILRNKRN